MSDPAYQVTNRRPDGTFPPGVSGNPSGRPAGKLSLRSLLREKLAEASEDLDAQGKTNAQYIVERLISQATHGNAQAMRLLWDYVEGPPTQSVSLQPLAPDPLAEAILADPSLTAMASALLGRLTDEGPDADE